MQYYPETVVVIYAVEGNPVDPQRALNHLESLEKPDTVLSSANSPGPNGWYLCSLLAQNSVSPIFSGSSTTQILKPYHSLRQLTPEQRRFGAPTLTSRRPELLKSVMDWRIAYTSPRPSKRDARDL